MSSIVRHDGRGGGGGGGWLNRLGRSVESLREIVEEGFCFLDMSSIARHEDEGFCCLDMSTIDMTGVVFATHHNVTLF